MHIPFPVSPEHTVDKPLWPQHRRSTPQHTGLQERGIPRSKTRTLRYAIVLPGRSSAFLAGFWPDCYRERTEIGPQPAEGRPEGRFRCFPGGSPAKIRPGRPISGPEALSCNIVALCTRPFPYVPSIRSSSRCGRSIVGQPRNTRDYKLKSKFEFRFWAVFRPNLAPGPL